MYLAKCLPSSLGTSPLAISLENIGFHGLRHTVGTRLVVAGVDLITVKELLAHSSLTTTQRYTHATQDRKFKAISVLNSYS